MITTDIHTIHDRNLRGHSKIGWLDSEHSEFNNSESNPAHFLQIWMLPDRKNITPRYEQRDFPLAEKQGKLRLVGSKDGRDGSVVINQDIDLYVSVLSVGDSIKFEVKPNRFAWIQVARGIATLNGESLSEGDGVQINSPELLELTTEASAEILLFDLA
jgi:quercetin 2,3-dioxygenase